MTFSRNCGKCGGNWRPKHKVPPYIIFSDETLREMCAYMPQTEDALLEVKGIGAMKRDKYGAEFLAVLQQEASK